MKSIVVAVALTAGLLVIGSAAAQDGKALAEKDGCMTCHAVDTKKMGPAFKDVAAKLKGKSAADMVAAFKGAKPHGSSKASDADIAAIGKWIQSL
jgi:cytochrome c